MEPSTPSYILPREKKENKRLSSSILNYLLVMVYKYLTDILKFIGNIWFSQTINSSIYLKALCSLDFVTSFEWKRMEPILHEALKGQFHAFA